MSRELFRFSTFRAVLGLPLKHKEMKILWYSLLAQLDIEEGSHECYEFNALLNSYANSLRPTETVKYNKMLHKAVYHSLPKYCLVLDCDG
jgi:hypothetical protein